MHSTLSTYPEKTSILAASKMKTSLKEKVCHFYIVDNKGTEINLFYRSLILKYTCYKTKWK